MYNKTTVFNFNKITSAVFAVLLLCSFGLQAQDACAPVGWVTQNGGVTGGGSAAPTVVSTYSALKSAIESASVKVVHISGTITFPSNGRINFQDQSGKTVYGLPGSKLISTDLSAGGSGIFYLKRLSNVIIRNVYFEGPGAYDTDGNDNMTIDNCTNIWVDHCEFHDGMDGNLDVKNAANYISITWCTFSYEKAPIPNGPGGANDHRYSNLFGSSDGATGDDGKLKITMQYNWWGQGCRERMPRVRYGQIHMVNNYFSSSVANHGIRAGYKANIRAEGNYFVSGFSKPIDEFDGNYTAIYATNNVNAPAINKGTIFTPPYSLTIANPNNIVSIITSCAGQTMSSPTTCGCGGSITQPATLVKGGSGSSTQTINQGSAITTFNYTWANATGATVTGLPTGVSATINTTAKTVTISGTPSVAGTFNFTVTTTGGNPNATATGTITVASQNLDCNGVANGTAKLDNCGRCSGGNTGVVACTGSVQAEEACVYDGTVDNNNAGFTGTGFVNTTNAVGAKILWSINSTTATSATLSFIYANGGTTDRGATLRVNGTTISTLPFSSTGAWTTWSPQKVTVQLNTGNNSVELVATTADGIVNMDQLVLENAGITKGTCTTDCAGQIGGGAYTDVCGKCVGGTSGATTDDFDNDGTPNCSDQCPNDANKITPGVCGCGVTEESCIDCNGDVNGTAYLDNCGVCVGGNSVFKSCVFDLEAEEACSFDGTIDNNNPGFSGVGFVNTTNTLGSSVSWKFQSTSAQTVTISFKYANGGTTSRDGNISVNGNSASPLVLAPTGAWTNWEIKAVNVQFVQGLNEVEVVATTADGLANIDLLSFSEGVSPHWCVTGTADDLLNTELVPFPNPTHNQVQWNGIFDWVLHNAQGIKVSSGTGFKINLEAYPSGLYLLNINGKVIQIVKE